MTIELDGTLVPEVYLWRSVITQAIDDATMRIRPPKEDAIDKASRLKAMQENARQRDLARIWLIGNSADFRRVCDMALLDASAVRERALKLQRDGWPAPPKRKERRRVGITEAAELSRC